MRGGIGWLFGLVGVGIAAALVVSDDGEAPIHTQTGGGGQPAMMTCEQAIANLPASIRENAAAALKNGVNPEALDMLALTLESGAGAAGTDPLVRIALLKVGQCLRDRASAIRAAGKSVAAAPPPMAYAGAGDLQTERLDEDVLYFKRS